MGDLAQLVRAQVEEKAFDGKKAESLDWSRLADPDDIDGISVLLREGLQDRYARLLNDQQYETWMKSFEASLVGVGIGFNQRRDPDGKRFWAPKNGEPDALPYLDNKGFPVISRVIPSGPAWLAGIRNGESIAAIDGNPTAGATFKSLINAIRGEEGSEVVLNIRRHKGRSRRIVLKRACVRVPSVNFFELAGGIGYLQITDFMNPEVVDQSSRALQELAHCDRLVVDVRGNGGGLLPTSVETTGKLCPDGSLLIVVSWRNANGFQSEASYIDSRSGSIRKVSIQGRPPFHLRKEWTGRPTAVLVDGDTSSGGEILAGALQDNGVPVVGETTFGKGICQQITPIPYRRREYKLFLTARRLYSPSGNWVGNGDDQAIGMTPDHPVRQENLSLALGHPATDAQLAKAISLLA